MSTQKKDPSPSHMQGLPEWFARTRLKEPTPLGTITFFILRILDIGLQYCLLRYNWAARLLSALGAHPSLLHSAATTSGTTGGLTPYAQLLVALAAGSTVQQLYWLYVLTENAFPAGFAAGIAAYNTLLNSTNTMLGVWAWSSGAPRAGASWQELIIAPTVVGGVALYALGLGVEVWTERQRKAFKADSKNRGKPCGEALWGYALNANYGGYMLFRAGYSMVAAGLGWGTTVVVCLGCDFYFRAIPLLDTYMEGRYGDDFREIRRKVKYRLIPGIV
ncbi:MAG: hypothetical protein M1822_005008 [Bathelium mastoideum]|nr:MAG: hypothetical protein M1822_005008 [Bathelium mastoideum]